MQVYLWLKHPTKGLSHFVGTAAGLLVAHALECELIDNFSFQNHELKMGHP